MIPQRSLSALSNRLQKEGGKRIPEAILEKDYCIAWILKGIARTKLPEMIAFKGGTALKRCYFGDYRFSEDLDFTLLEGANLEDVLKEFEAAFKETQNASGVKAFISRTEEDKGRNSHTFYIGYEGPLPATARTKEIKVDITLTETIVTKLEKRPVLKAYEEFTDIEETDMLTVYSLDEIVVEKTVALMDKARTEPRDLYDIWILTTDHNVDLQMLEPEIEKKLNFREKKIEDVRGVFEKKEARYKALWKTRLENQMSQLDEFETAWRDVQKEFRKTKLAAS